MVSRTVCLLALVGVVVAACSATPSADEIVETPEATTTTAEATITTAVEATTTTTVEAVDSELVALVKHVFDEWNSGDTAKWRATFAEDATKASFGQQFPIDSFTDEYEFFTVLGEMLILGACVSVEDNIQCEATSSNRWTDTIGASPVSSVHTFEIFDGLIVSHTPDFSGAGDARTAWGEFAAWVEDQHGVDIHGFPGEAESATTALDYMNNYSQSG